MKTSGLLKTFDALGPVHALVLGDLILDRYTWGDAERVSQEAPVILLRADRREDRLGGAANVCQLLRGLEAEVTCAGVLGNDAAGKKVRQLLTAAGIRDEGVLTDRQRPTTRKERFIGRAANRHGHQILRVDTEVREPLTRKIETELITRSEKWLSAADDNRVQVVLVSDYDKGVCTPRLLEHVISAARAAGIPVVVDPVRGGDYSRYRGATTMTPNRLEAGLATGTKIVALEDAYVAGRKLCDTLDLEFAVVTLDRDGMALVPRQTARKYDQPASAPQHFPTRPRDVYDITGAGDMVLATIGVCLAAGVTPADAVRLGNITGGLEVEKEGVVVIGRDEIRQDLMRDAVRAETSHSPGADPAAKIVSLEALLEAVASHRRQGHSIVMTNGCFDLLHVGHLQTLEEAAQQGDTLIVAVNSDQSVRRLKGEDRPIVGQQDRLRMLAALAVVDYVLTFDDATPESLLHQLKPDVLVKGGTYAEHEVVGHEIVTAYGGRIHRAPPVKGVSTTQLLRTLSVHPASQQPHHAPHLPAAGSSATASVPVVPESLEPR